MVSGIMWRHESVLSTLHPVISKQLDTYNSVTQSNVPTHIPIHLVHSGDRSTTGINYLRPSLLSNAADCKLLLDYDQSPIIFPPEIIPTPERPDIIIWSNTTKHVILFELTCCAE